MPGRKYKSSECNLSPRLEHITVSAGKHKCGAISTTETTGPTSTAMCVSGSSPVDRMYYISIFASGDFLRQVRNSATYSMQKDGLTPHYRDDTFPNGVYATTYNVPVPADTLVKYIDEHGHYTSQKPVEMRKVAPIPLFVDVFFKATLECVESEFVSGTVSVYNVIIHTPRIDLTTVRGYNDMEIRAPRVTFTVPETGIPERGVDSDGESYVEFS